LEDTRSRLLQGRAQQGDVGVWLDEEDDLQVEDRTTVSDPGPSSDTWYSCGTPSRMTDQLMEVRLPQKVDQEKLANIFFRRIHPVLPLLDEEDVRARMSTRTLSPRLLQAICLAASKDASAGSLLSLGTSSSILTVAEFGRLVYDDLARAMSNKMEKSRITVIQILTIMSLHTSGPEGLEEASLHLAEAIHRTQTLGLHLTSQARRPSGNVPRSMFWCLWSLDKWNAAIHGRPVIINDSDMNQEVADVIPSFPPAFRVWLSLTATLSKVINFYKPVPTLPHDDSEIQIPSFEALVDNCNGWDTAVDALCR
jgi:hypothetical protein